MIAVWFVGCLAAQVGIIYVKKVFLEALRLGALRHEVLIRISAACVILELVKICTHARDLIED